MALLNNKTNETYYTGSQSFYISGTISYTYTLTEIQTEHGGKITADDIRVYVESNNSNYTDREIFDWTVSNGVLTVLTAGAAGGDGDQAFDELNEINAEGVLRVELRDHIFGGYRHTSLSDIVSNFIIGYVGDGKLINNASKTDVVFHARRGLQEFSYDILKTVKSQEVELSPSLAIPMPQDYVSYVKLCYIDNSGIKKIIYPTKLTINPTEAPVQDGDYNYIFDNNGQIVSGTPYTETQWQAFDTDNLTGNLSTEEDYYISRDNHLGTDFGRRYGIEPEHQQINGYFTINERTGSFNFSSDLSGKIIVIEYVSDSLGTDAEMKVHKFAEEALYKHIAFNILSTRRNIPEYIVQRFRKERRAAMRNAKLRLSKINLAEISQVLRGQSKRIKN
jgi:hypothetical protein